MTELTTEEKINEIERTGILIKQYMKDDKVKKYFEQKKSEERKKKSREYYIKNFEIEKKKRRIKNIPMTIKKYYEKMRRLKKELKELEE